MDSETKTNANSVESAVAPDSATNEHNQPETSERTESKNVIDVIGNGQLVKTVWKW